jgi:hypothetical protein
MQNLTLGPEEISTKGAACVGVVEPVNIILECAIWLHYMTPKLTCVIGALQKKRYSLFGSDE